jgi:hypothetical protein
MARAAEKLTHHVLGVPQSAPVFGAGPIEQEFETDDFCPTV